MIGMTTESGEVDALEGLMVAALSDDSFPYDWNDDFSSETLLQVPGRRSIGIRFISRCYTRVVSIDSSVMKAWALGTAGVFLIALLGVELWRICNTGDRIEQLGNLAVNKLNASLKATEDEDLLLLDAAIEYAEKAEGELYGDFYKHLTKRTISIDSFQRKARYCNYILVHAYHRRGVLQLETNTEQALADLDKCLYILLQREFDQQSGDADVFITSCFLLLSARHEDLEVAQAYCLRGIDYWERQEEGEARDRGLFWLNRAKAQISLRIDDRKNAKPQTLDDWVEFWRSAWRPSTASSNSR